MIIFCIFMPSAFYFKLIEYFRFYIGVEFVRFRVSFDLEILENIKPFETFLVSWAKLHIEPVLPPRQAPPASLVLHRQGSPSFFSKPKQKNPKQFSILFSP
jgi:hypothetical protein